ncbi:hypothetical protein LguiB_020930 [Lonicera macranthoides]
MVVSCDQYVHNVIMAGYTKYGPVKDAREVFDELPGRTVADWHLMVYRYWNCGNEVEAQRFFDLLPERNVITWLYANCGSLETASKTFNKLGSRRNSVAWNVMISVYTRVGDLTSTRSECCLIVCLKRMLSCGAHRFLVMHKMDNRHWLLSSSKKWSKPITRSLSNLPL